MAATVGRGGMEKHFVELCHALTERGVAVTAVADPTFADRLHPPVKHVPLEMTGSRFSPRRLARLVKILRAADADIIHTHATKAAAMMRLVRPFVRRGRHIATVHGYKKNVRAYQAADAVICVSHRVGERIHHPGKHVIYNGVAPPARCDPAARQTIRRELGIGDEEPMLLAIGRLAPVKGFDVLLQAMVGVEATLVIVGDGPKASRLQRQAKQVGVSDRVIFAGYRDDVHRFTAAADLAVISSRREGFAYVLIEMLQAGLPVISTDVGDMRQVLGDDVTVPVEDPAALHARLAAALEDLPGLRERFEPTIARARREFTLDHMAAATIDLYQQMLRRE